MQMKDYLLGIEVFQLKMSNSFQRESKNSRWGLFH
jgi:hypothetical protein